MVFVTQLVGWLVVTQRMEMVKVRVKSRLGMSWIKSLFLDAFKRQKYVELHMEDIGTSKDCRSAHQTGKAGLIHFWGCHGSKSLFSMLF